ncbi:MAG: hypothetical protein AAF602_27330 [Myxococcota bacterium]
MVVMLWHLLTGVVLAAPSTEGFDLLEDILEDSVQAGSLAPDEVLPALLVSTQPIYEESAPGFETRALRVLLNVFGDQGLRICQACMAPRTFVEDGNLVLQTGPISLDDVRRLDEAHRGDDAPARTAIWLDEYPDGVSLRIVDLTTARVVFAVNSDQGLKDRRRRDRRYRLAAELDRRAREGTLTQAFVDVGIWPRPIIHADWTDQFGKGNQNMAGFSLSVLEPFIGFGAVYHRRIPIANTLIGAKVYFSLPTAFGGLFDDSGDLELVDPLVTGVGTVRVPLGRQNFGLVFSATTSGRVGIGISLLNISLLPVIP